MLSPLALLCLFLRVTPLPRRLRLLRPHMTALFAVAATPICNSYSFTDSMHSLLSTFCCSGCRPLRGEAPLQRENSKLLQCRVRSRKSTDIGSRVVAWRVVVVVLSAQN